MTLNAITLKTKHTTSNFEPWKEKISDKVKEKTTKLKQKKIEPKQTKLVLSYQDVKKHLEEFHRKFIMSPLAKIQTSLHLYVKNTAFPNY